MISIDGDLSEEKVRLLLDEAHESEQLDYKCMLTTNAAKNALDSDAAIELAKDIAAMQALGGYIVVGADGSGQPSALFTLTNDEARKCYDEAKVRAQIKKWIDEPLDLKTAVRVISGNVFAIIYVGRRRDGFCVLRADGFTSANLAVFRNGDVFVRHGTASERWRQHDVNILLEGVVAARKEEWRRELRPVIEHAEGSKNTHAIADRPLESLSWRLDANLYYATLTELLRCRDDVAIEHHLRSALQDGISMLAGNGVDDELLTLLDRICVVVQLCEIYRRVTLEAAAMRVLVRLYEYGFVDEHRQRPFAKGSAAQLWKEVIIRVYAIGAARVREARWAGIRRLIVAAGPPGITRYWVSWIRHGYTMTSRAGMLNETVDGRKRELAFLQFVKEYMNTTPQLTFGDPCDVDAILDAICQFDFLAGLIATAQAGEVSARTITIAYTRYNNYRTEPIVELLIDQAHIRKKMAELDNKEFAFFLAESEKIASSVPTTFMTWDGFQGEKIKKYIVDNLGRSGEA